MPKSDVYCSLLRRVLRKSLRILSRLSTDLTIIEVQILNNLWGTFDSFFNLIGMIAAVALGATWILLALPPFALCYYFLQRRYRYLRLRSKDTKL
jgi:TRAP-type C4-dicarboxylate transport system permease small subunit